MTHMTYTPGYQGYLRNFQREWVSGGRSEQSRKYADLAEEVHGLQADEWRARSHASSSFDAARILAHQEKLQRQAQREAQAARDAAAHERWMNHGAATERYAPYSHVHSHGPKSQLAGGTLSALPPAAGRKGSPQARPASGATRGLWGTTSGDTIGAGRRPAPSPVHPRFPHAPTQFMRNSQEEKEPMASLPEGQSLNARSLAQAIAELPAAENLLQANPALHGTYARDYGARGSHPLHRHMQSVGGGAAEAGTAAAHPGSSLTQGSASSAYGRDWRAPTHVHTFPSTSLIGPSGGWAGPHPIEGRNHFARTSPYELHDVRESDPRSSNPFLRGGEGATLSQQPHAAVGGSGFIPISERGTTKELFAGSTKHSGQARIPGYAGFVPSSTHSRLSQSLSRGPAPGPSPNAQAHLLRTFSHDLPGYSGHHPASVTNVRGPRTPRGKKRMNEGLTASLILDSMKA